MPESPIEYEECPHCWAELPFEKVPLKEIPKGEVKQILIKICPSCGKGTKKRIGVKSLLDCIIV